VYVADTPTGTIIARSADQFPGLLATIAQDLHDARIVVCCATRHEAGELRSYLQAHGLRERMISRDGAAPQVVVDLPLPARAVIDDCDVLVFARLRSARGRYPHHLYDAAIRARRLLLLDERPIRGWDKLWIPAWFGVEQMRVPGPIEVWREVRVRWHPHAGHRDGGDDERTPALLLEHVIGCRERNRRLAKLCRALVDDASNGNIVLLVESIRHGALLADQLPG
jgi:hypothetical protein